VKYKFEMSKQMEQELNSPTGVADPSIFAKAPVESLSQCDPLPISSEPTICIPMPESNAYQMIRVQIRVRQKAEPCRVEPILHRIERSTAWSAWSYWQTARAQEACPPQGKSSGYSKGTNRKQYGTIQKVSF
jgi:hypothetical protein